MKERKVYEGTITEIKIKNRENADKWQNIFKVGNAIRDCVYWQRANIDVGDTVQLIGFETPTVFVAQKLLITKKFKPENADD